MGLLVIHNAVKRRHMALGKPKRACIKGQVRSKAGQGRRQVARRTGPGRI